MQPFDEPAHDFVFRHKRLFVCKKDNPVYRFGISSIPSLLSCCPIRVFSGTDVLCRICVHPHKKRSPYILYKPLCSQISLLIIHTKMISDYSEKVNLKEFITVMHVSHGYFSSAPAMQQSFHSPGNFLLIHIRISQQHRIIFPLRLQVIGR